MWPTENWIPAAVVFAGIAAILLFTWSITHRGLYVVLAGVSLLLIGGSYALDSAVTTESERVEQRTRDLADAFRRGDHEAVLSHFSKHAAFLKSFVANALERVDVHDDLRITDVATEVDGESASIHFRANATITVEEHGNVGYQPSRWRLKWEREDDRWVCTSAQRLHPVDGSEMQLLEAKP